jgi:hypothetical protein
MLRYRCEMPAKNSTPHFLHLSLYENAGYKKNAQIALTESKA